MPRDHGNASEGSDATGRVAVEIGHADAHGARIGAKVSENTDVIVLLPDAEEPVARQEGAFITQHLGTIRCDLAPRTSEATRQAAQGSKNGEDFGRSLYDGEPVAQAPGKHRHGRQRTGAPRWRYRHDR